MIMSRQFAIQVYDRYKKCHILRCKIPGYSNDTYAIQNENHKRLVQENIPPSTDPKHVYDECHIYSQSVNNVSHIDHVSNTSLTKCSEWANLVCDDSLKTSHAIMVFYFGVLVGDLAFGTFIGRRRTFQISAVLTCAVAFAVAWAPEFYSFCVLEFLMGATVHGFFLLCACFRYGVGWSIKETLCWCFYTHVFWRCTNLPSRRWLSVKTLEIYTVDQCSPNKSPRWLISKGRYKEAEEVIQTAARVNKVTLPDGLVDNKTFVIGMVFYGVTIHMGNIGGDFYLNFFIQSIISIPSFGCPLLLLDKIGRRKVHCICMLTAGFGGLFVLFPVIFGGPELYPLTITLAMFGKIGSAAAFSVVYTFSLELFPTVVRNGTMGVSSCVARIGSMAAPYIAIGGKMIGGKFGLAFPLIVFGGLSTAAGLLVLLLPETKGRKLPDTIQDGIVFGIFDTKKELTVNLDEGDRLSEKLVLNKTQCC
ncbi:hypothetical protein KUTeg_006588 [Tegillarca granosa]|uniref:Organic cation transporter protein n=1 Tax=Tegillarca granosa TaxID=220873 RepID=A0ABQ9FAS0_TEGGR|nr:hypothetical protein KUTeg_006588 [Tegillarca granosa]